MTDNPSHRAAPARIAADRIASAFRQARSKRIHLCPLDQADEVPLHQFGPNSIRRFTSDELDSLVDPHAIMRKLPDWQFDSRRFSEFSWLVVEELVDLPGEAEARADPSSFIDFTEDFGRIEPHRSLYPGAVENALFALFTAPWEDVTVHSDFD